MNPIYPEKLIAHKQADGFAGNRRGFGKASLRLKPVGRLTNTKTAQEPVEKKGRKMARNQPKKYFLRCYNVVTIHVYNFIKFLSGWAYFIA
ncbi:MAG: hypothetical protein QME32_00640 [Endomicrobiia bacterium]|nr:hypothetical protein [Endomicrobiia bacterium]